MADVFRFFVDHFPALLDLNFTVCFVIGFVLCVRQFLKGAPKVFSYALWGIVLLRLLVPVSIESPVSFVPERTEFSSMVEVSEVLPEISFETPKEFEDALIKLYEDGIIPAMDNGLCGCILTQISDIEDETNGLITYDRMRLKVNKENIKELHSKIYGEFLKKFKGG